MNKEKLAVSSKKFNELNSFRYELYGNKNNDFPELDEKEKTILICDLLESYYFRTRTADTRGDIIRTDVIDFILEEYEYQIDKLEMIKNNSGLWQKLN